MEITAGGRMFVVFEKLYNLVSGTKNMATHSSSYFVSRKDYIAYLFNAIFYHAHGTERPTFGW